MRYQLILALLVISLAAWGCASPSPGPTEPDPGSGGTGNTRAVTPPVTSSYAWLSGYVYGPGKSTPGLTITAVAADNMDLGVIPGTTFGPSSVRFDGGFRMEGIQVVYSFYDYHLYIKNASGKVVGRTEPTVPFRVFLSDPPFKMIISIYCVSS